MSLGLGNFTFWVLKAEVKNLLNSNLAYFNTGIKKTSNYNFLYF